jgi:hypothetical protein
MRAFTLGLLVFGGLGISRLAYAVTYPATTTLVGEIAQSVVGNQCYIARGGSEFPRNEAAKTGFVTIPEMVAAGYALNGRITLAFTTTDSGQARFPFGDAYPANIQVVPFSGYSQAYMAATKVLNIRFTITFPGCTLPVHATYNSP